MEKERREEEKKKKEEGRREEEEIQVWKFGTHVWNSCMEFLFGTLVFVYLEPMYGFVG